MTRFLALFGLLIGLLAVAPAQPHAQDSAKTPPAVKAREFTDEEVAAADKVRLALSAQDLVLYNGLRYLLRPAYETELFAGRRYRPGGLASLETASTEPMTMAEHLRLWAVLQSGMELGQALENEITRLLLSTRDSGAQLAGIGVEMATLRAVYLRGDAVRSAAIAARAKELLAQARKLAVLTSQKSPFVQGAVIYPQWFGFQLWRSVIMRAALDLGLEADGRDWESDLRDLLRCWNKEKGWTMSKAQARSVNGDLHTNLMALTTLQLAAGAPDKTLSKALQSEIKKKLDDAPALLARLDREYETEGFADARLLLLQSMGDLAPQGVAGDPWREKLRRQGVANAEISGAFVARSGLQSDLFGTVTNTSRGSRTCMETALVLIALSGGLHATGKGPLAGQGLAGTGRVLYALSVWQASSARQEAGDFQGRVNAAIADGCDFIAASQLPNGSFPGTHAASLGNHAACVLTLMHGGWDRKGPVISNGLKYMLENRVAPSGTYANALALMAFQEYYIREQRENGLLGAESPAEFEAARGKVLAALDPDHRKFCEDLLKEIDSAASKKGGWGYTGVAGGRTSSVPSGNYADNSCSQYALLGYKAASMLGLRVDSKVFSDEANRLLRQYGPSKEMPEVEFVYEPDAKDGDEGERKTKARSETRKGTIQPGGWSYSQEWRDGGNLQMTAAGISSLTVCMDELKVRGKLGRDLAWRIALTIHGAQHFMAAQYYKPANFENEERNVLTQSGDGMGGYYNLYSVERACMLAGLSRIGSDSVDWYQIGANALLDAQQDDGSWDGNVWWSRNADQPQVRGMINTCMAILFLRQASLPVITEHKKREKEREEREKQPPEAPRSPITPGPKEKSPAPGPAGEGK